MTFTFDFCSLLLRLSIRDVPLHLWRRLALLNILPGITACNLSRDVFSKRPAVMKQWDVPPAGKLTAKLYRRLHFSCARQQALCLNSLAPQREISRNDLAEAGASDFSTTRERMQALLCLYRVSYTRKTQHGQQ